MVGVGVVALALHQGILNPPVSGAPLWPRRARGSARGGGELAARPRQPLSRYLVPNRRSPASPRPGTM